MFSSTSLASLALAFGLTTQIANAHMQLLFPPGINSKFDPQTPQNLIDYSNTSPMNSDGSNYPCKGYATAALINPLKPVATLTSGSPFTITLDGSATHMGGSCQFSVSYDQGVTFAVLTSIIGGCPLSSTYTIPIPQLPSAAKALFAWTWYNHDGNREEYSNCAVVNIVGTASSFTGPAVFRANTLGDAACQNVGGQDTVFPNPGPSVQYGNGQSASSPPIVMPGCSFNENHQVTVSPSSSSSSSAPVVPVAPVAPVTPVAPAPVAPVAPAPVAPAPVAPASAPLVVTNPPIIPAPVAPSGPIVPAQRPLPKSPTLPLPIAKVPTSKTPSAPAAPVAPVVVPAPVVNSSGAAYVLCTSKTTWSLCGGNKCTPMGNVAAGTECNNGVISWPQKRMKRSMHKRTSSHGGRSDIA